MFCSIPVPAVLTFLLCYDSKKFPSLPLLLLIPPPPILSPLLLPSHPSSLHSSLPSLLPSLFFSLLLSSLPSLLPSSPCFPPPLLPLLPSSPPPLPSLSMISNVLNISTPVGHCSYTKLHLGLIQQYAEIRGDGSVWC